MKYSPLTQITPANVAQLDESVDLRHWACRHRATRSRRSSSTTSCTSRSRASIIVALKADAGTELWKFDLKTIPGIGAEPVGRRPRHLLLARHGAASAPRIVIATTNGFLVQLDAKTGKPIPGPGRPDQPRHRRDGEVRRHVLHQHAAGALQEPGDRRRPHGRAGPLRHSRRSARVRSADRQGSLAVPRRAAARTTRTSARGASTAGRIGAVPASGCR